MFSLTTEAKQTRCLALVLGRPVTTHNHVFLLVNWKSMLVCWLLDLSFCPRLKSYKTLPKLEYDPFDKKNAKQHNDTIHYAMATPARETSSMASKKRRLAPLSPCISFTKPACACCKAPAQSFKLSRSKTLWFDGERRTSFAEKDPGTWEVLKTRCLPSKMMFLVTSDPFTVASYTTAWEV